MRDWYTFFRKDDEAISYRITGEVLVTQTQFQKVEILETSTFGRALFLDDSLQSTELDEFTYHEAMVHPALCLHPKPRRVFVAGGGEGALVREVLKHGCVEQVWMCDIDRELVEIARKHLVSWHRGAFDDPRLNLLYMDARACLADSDSKFDIVIVDVTAPKAGSPVGLLYTKEFYQLVATRLNPNGVLVTQAQSTNANNLAFFATLNRTMAEAFTDVCPYAAALASDGDNWGYALASNSRLQPFSCDVDGVLANRRVSDLRLYSSEAHKNMFSLPKYVREALRSPVQISTDRRPFSYEALSPLPSISLEGMD